MRVSRLLVISAGLCSLGFLGLDVVHSPAQAANVKIVQKDKSFGVKKLTVKVGDTMVFVNEDKVTHNMFSKTKGNEFEIKKQQPATIEKVPVAKAGKFKVKCAIHPKMKLKVTAE